MVFDSEIFDTEENDTKKSNPLVVKNSKFQKKRFLLKKKRSSTDEPNQCSKKPKIDKEEQQLIKLEQKEEEPIPEEKEIIQTNNSSPHSLVDLPAPLENINEQVNPIEMPLESSTDQTTSQSSVDELSQNPIIVTDQCHTVDVSSSDMNKSSPIPLSETNETVNPVDCRSISYQKPSSTSLHLLPPILTPDSDVFTSPYQHFSYPLFVPPISSKIDSKIFQSKVFYGIVCCRFTTIVNTNSID